MTLGQHELVIRPEHVVIQIQEYVEAREVTPDVAHAAFIMHAQRGSNVLAHAELLKPSHGIVDNSHDQLTLRESED